MSDDFYTLIQKKRVVAPEGKPKMKSKKEDLKKKSHSGRKKLFYWRYDDKYTIGSVLHGEGKFSDPKRLTCETEINKYEKELAKINAKPRPAHEFPIGIERFSYAYQKFGSHVECNLSTFEEFQKLMQEGMPADERLAVLKIVCDPIQLALLQFACAVIVWRKLIRVHR